MRSLEYESEDELDALDEKSIGDFKQWRLLLAVCPIFGHDHPWTAFNQNTRDVTVIKRQSKLLTTHFLEIPLHAPTDSLLTGNECEDFERTIDALISSLECLVNGEKLPARAVEAVTALDPTPDFDLERRCPNLLALSSLSQDGPEHYSQYLHLSQKAKTFKKTCNEVRRFLECLEMLRTDREAASTRHAPEGVSRLRKEAQPNIRFSHTLWSRSKSLFESLVTSLRTCDRIQPERNMPFSSHKAMLHLKSAQDHQCGDQDLPEVSIALAACADQKTWHQIHCTLSPSNTAPRSATPVTPISNICEAAKIAYEEDRLFKIEHHGAGSFTDVSDRHYGPGTYLNAHPTISLSDLLANNILRDQYRFYPCDKKVLAFGLAHALLQFSEGPWMQTLWTHDQVFFMYETETKTVYNIHQPWISCIVSEPVPTLDPLDKAHPFPVILSFAKLLLELENGEEFKADKRSHGKTPSLVASLWEYCRVWNSRLLDDDYSQAVDACVNFVRYLRQHQEDDFKTTQEQAVRDVILARIVIPLGRRVDMSQKSNWGHQNLNLHDLVPTVKPAVSRVIPAAGHVPTTMRLHHPNHTLQQPGPSRQTSKLTAEADPPHFSSRCSSEKLNGLKRKQNLPQRAEPSINTNVSGTRLNTGAPRAQKGSVPNAGPSKSTATARQAGRRFVTYGANRSPASHGSLPTPETRRNSPRALIPPVNDKHAPISIRRLAVSNINGVTAPVQTVPEFSDYLSGFGTCLRHDHEAFNDVSTSSFKYISMTVDARMVHNRKDKPVCVAVLDTGFDRAHADFQQPRTKHFKGERGDQSNPEVSEVSQRDRIVGCRDFCRPGPGSHLNSGGVYNSSSEDEDKDGNLHDVPDLDGHGTKVAGILLRVAPRANLLIARVSLGENSGDVPDDQASFKRPQPETVAKAIEWALRKGADIINLSLGFRNYSSEKLAILRRALDTASNRKVVVFAATSNEGSHEPVAWPASDRNLAIGVHSCTDNGGRKSDFTAEPSRHGVNFMVVGERILSQRLTSRGGGFELCSGSSFATPVAAAIGALVLAFTRQRVCYQNAQRAGRIILDDLHSTSGMIKVLEAISTQVEFHYWSLKSQMFWATYRPSSEDPTEDEEDARRHAWRIIQDALRP